MLQHNPPTRMTSEMEDSPSDIIDLERIVGIVRRQWKFVGMIAVVGMLAALGYLFVATPFYRATTEIMLDNAPSQTPSVLSDLIMPVKAEEEILSQVELLGSVALAEKAVRELALADNREFLESALPLQQQLISGLRGLLRLEHDNVMDLPPESRHSRAVGIVLDNTTIARVGRTYLLSITYSASSPAVAADVANALADAYLLDQLEARFDAAQRSTSWLEERLQALQQESLAADLAVQQYRADNGLLTADGELVSDQQLSAANTSLLTAQSRTAEAKARLDTVNAVLSAGDEDAIVSAALDSNLINNLQQRYLDATARRAAIVQRVGEQHSQAIQLDQEMSQLRQLMRNELERIAASQQNEYNIALNNEQNLRANLATATATSTAANSTQAKLRELELKAQSIRGLYQNFLQSYQATGESASFPVSGARVVNAASIPNRPSSPVTALVLAIGAMLGGAAGVGLAGIREFNDRFVRTGEHVRSSIGLEYLGMVPLINAPARPSKNKQLQPRVVANLRGTRYVNAIENPVSQLAETLRATKVAADLALPERRSRVLGMISLLSEEGKSVVASNLAMLLANIGHKVLLVDADLRHPSLSRQLAPHAATGLVAAMVNFAALEQAIHVDEASNLHFLPVGSRESVPNSADMLSSPAFDRMLETMRQRYDYIVLDLPPLAPVVDARAVSHKVDAFVWVVQWGRIPRQFLRSSLEREGHVASKTLGVIINQVDMKKLKLYSTASSSEYYMSSYNKYFDTLSK